MLNVITKHTAVVKLIIVVILWLVDLLIRRFAIRDLIKFVKIHLFFVVDLEYFIYIYKLNNFYSGFLKTKLNSGKLYIKV